MIWATVEHVGWGDLVLPAGCESVGYGGYGGPAGRRTLHVVRVDDRAALLRLVAKENCSPMGHSDCPGGGQVHVTAFDTVGVTWTCDSCPETWVTTYEPEDEDDWWSATAVPTYRTKREATEAADEFSWGGFLGAL